MVLIKTTRIFKMLIDPTQIVSAIDPVEEQRDTVGTRLAAHELGIYETVKLVIEANEGDQGRSIAQLEQQGLPIAAQIVTPMLAIAKRSPDSPLRKLSGFQMSTLYPQSPRLQSIVLDQAEEALTAGESISFVTGVAHNLVTRHRSQVAVAKARAGMPTMRSRDDVMRDNDRLKQQLSLYEKALERAAAGVGLDVQTFVSEILEG